MSAAKPAKSRCTVRTRPRSSAETAMAIASAPHTSVVCVRMSFTIDGSIREDARGALKEPRFRRR